jgi:putative transposon-encoded protein
MPRVVLLERKTKLTVDRIVGFVRRPVVPHGTGAKVTCPKEFLGKTAYLVITDEDWVVESPKGSRS